MKHSMYAGATVLGIAFATAPIAGAAAQAPLVAPSSPKAGADALDEAKQYWTPERLRNATPMAPTTTLPNRGLSSPRSAVSPEGATPTEPGSIVPGAPPTREFDPSQSEQILPPDASGGAPRADLSTSRPAVAPELQPEESGTGGAFFTTSRVFPDDAATAYPYATAGRLTFHDPVKNADFICSAAVLRRRIVVTAGHCVIHPDPDPKKAYFFEKFLFVPAFTNGNAPFGTWVPQTVGTSSDWANSDGSVPNTQDVGMLVMFDDPSATRIGDRTGTLGYQTGALFPNHLTMLGYPGNLDNASLMIRNDAQSFAQERNNNVVYGSAMTNGSSGGPWIRDFGIEPQGLIENQNARFYNVLVGVTSAGPDTAGVDLQSASNLQGRTENTGGFEALLDNLCGLDARNCAD